MAALIARDGKLLICQRSAAGSFPNKWEFPGGKVERDEAPAAALRRELQEELSIQAEIGEELSRVTHQYQGRRPVCVLFFHVSRFEGMLTNRVFQQICWATPDQLPSFDFLDADRGVVQQVAAGEILVKAAEASAAE